MTSVSWHQDAGKHQHGFDSLAPELPETLLDLLRRRAWVFGDACAYRFLHDDDTQTAVSFLELDRRARAVAQQLRMRVEPGERVLLMFPPGLDFIEAFFGCIYAGALAVPLNPPKRRDLAARISAIVENCQATVGLTDAWGQDILLGIDQSGYLEQLEWIAVDKVDNEASEQWEPPEIKPDDPAFLQYTSGSTERPRGVVLSHGNLVHNLEVIHKGFGLKRGTPEEPAGTGVSWLPVYHDMGLIGGMLESLWAGGTTLLMSPSSFLQRPERWLRAISDYGASVSGAPNFAYDLCVRKVNDDALASLDLSKWRVAFCGAEPIRPETLERFVDKFGPCGFRRDALYPCYGLAEATLLVTGNHGPRVPTIRRFDRSQIQSEGVAEPAREEGGNTRRLVGCGSTLLDQEVAIVNPLTRANCPEGRIGEIWVQGPSVAAGYWGREPSSEDFHAYCSDTGDGPYLRTGDLGFLHGEELFVTGRLKELLIIRGRNLDPTDIEFTAQSAHPAWLPDSGAAFSHEVDGEERLVLVNELDRAYRTASFEESFRAVRRRIIEAHGVDPHALVLVRPMALPRTTSGKIRRTLIADLYARGDLKVVAEWNKQPVPPSSLNLPSFAETETLDRRQVDRLSEQIEQRILKWLRDRVGVPEEELDRGHPFAEYGVDSMAAVELSHELESWLKIKLSPMVAWQYPTPAAIARHLAFATAASDDDRSAEPPAAAREEETGLEQLLDTLDTLGETEAAELLEEGEVPHQSG